MSTKEVSSNEPFKIAGTTVEPGSRKIVHLSTGTLPNLAGFALEMLVVHGLRPGNRLFISSTIHGDEVNGIETIRRVLVSPLIKHIQGTLIAIPIVNLNGMVMQSRYLPDRRDLNRSFPGSSAGSAAAQLAHTFLTEIVERCTHGIDLHTGSNHRINLPQLRCDFQSKEALKMAFSFAPPIILKARLRDGSLREASEKRGIPTVTFEGGEALRFNEFAIRSSVRGIFRVMKFLKMIPTNKVVYGEVPLVSPLSRWVRAPATGIFRTTCSLGKKVAKGEIIGKVSNPLGMDSFDVISSLDGIIVGITQLPVVYQGDALFNVAWVRDPAKAEAAIEEFEEEALEFGAAFDDPMTY